ncbi:MULTISPECIES: hypothetical protein [Bacillus cereus group]|uniref:Uncharacterized protein n=1 Tax=Bacillus proteolyticus TaxID=2026192 RepID=A0ABV3IGB6_9BACI|nr:hypothetical protein [Bacillus cereus group sp. N8]MBJ8106189.1 hypothetical protein [Bacillus cereus group sp. N8]
MQVACSEQEGVGSPDEEALFASQEGMKRPTVLATGTGLDKKWKRLAQNEKTLKQRMEATKVYKK